ncbi:hypothetical protein ANCDUO_26958, partial [Ancylostoma duodenale]
MNKEAAAVAAESQDKERLSTNQVELKADLRINLLDTVRNIKIGRAGKIAVPLPKKSDGGKQWKAPYLGEMYSLDMTIPEEKKDLEVVALNTESGSSELELEYAVKHLPDENPLILPFPSTDFAKKKKSRVLVEEAGAWSQEFPLDTVGNPARITCKGKDRDYEIDNDNIGVEACVSTSESSVAIHLTPFQPGMAPVCIMNNLNIPVNFGQKGHTMQSVATNEMVYFTWDNVTEERIMQ